MNEIIKKVETGIAKSIPLTNPAQEFMANATGKVTVTITDELGVSLTMDIAGPIGLTREMHDDYIIWDKEKRYKYCLTPMWNCGFECTNPVLTYPKGVQPINGINS